MKRCWLILTLLALVLTLSAPTSLAQESRTGLHGKVTDALTGEPLPFVQISFDGTSIGTTTDMDGRFSLVTDEVHTVVSLRMMGYEPLTLNLERGVVRRGVAITLTPQAKMLQEVQITTRRSGRTRYTRRNNPAVELVKKVIAHRDSNRLGGRPQYRRKMYEKLTLALDDFHPDFDHHWLWRRLDFLAKYIDQTPFDATPILTVSMRETMMEQTFSSKPRQKRTLVTGYRMEGIDQALGQEGIDESLASMFTDFGIYDQDIELMLNHFVGPLSPTLATSFYHYYITDTTWVDGVRCVELSFGPASSATYGFTGRMYVALDSTYRIARYSMTVSPSVNLNFVRNVTIEQTYCMAPDGSYVPGRQDVYCRLYLHPRLQELYAHRVLICTDYDFSANAPQLPDSLFGPTIHRAMLPDATKIRRRVWNSTRPIELTAKETVLDSLRYELARLPEFKALKNTGDVLLTGYIPTHPKRSESRFDLGPIFNTLSHNHEEGWRLRLGGMTTTRLNPHHFAEGYVAYGFGDRRFKYNASYIYTFDAKKKHAHEGPHSDLRLQAAYDLEVPGQSFGSFQHDNLLMSSSHARKIQYVGMIGVRLRKEWRSHLSLDTWLTARQIEPAGTLEYQQYQPDGSLQRVDRIGEAEWRGSLTFSPRSKQDLYRPGNSQILNLSANTPSLSLTHRIGLVDGTFLYHRTDLSAEKRFSLGAFGHIDTRLKAGIVWNRVPYPRLYFPDANSNLILADNAFNTMQPMEFVMDRHISLFATYHMKGLILNHVPLVKQLRLREVVGFNLLWGQLTPRNDPSQGSPTGLFALPDGTSALGQTPYIEYSVGIENILKFIRIDYVRRLTYTDGLPKGRHGFIRLDFRFTL